MRFILQTGRHSGKILYCFLPSYFFLPGEKKLIPVIKPYWEWIGISSVALIFLLFSAGNLIFLPVIDFLPYKNGVKIADEMVIPEGAAPDVYNTTFIYEKESIRKEFTLNDYPANDTTWKFIDQKSVLIKKGYVPPIHDFRITDFNGEDVTDRLLNGKGYSLLMITKKLDEASKKHLSAGFALGGSVSVKGIDFFIITSSGSEEVKNYFNGLKFCTADETTLKTMIRANPGYVLIKDGVITGKWSWANVPSAGWFATTAAQNK